jgi:hypothetical protein
MRLVADLENDFAKVVDLISTRILTSLLAFFHHILLGFSTFTQHPLHFASHFAWF